MSLGGLPLVLIAEDVQNDVELLQRSFGQAGISVVTEVVRDGEECIDYLAGRGKFANRDEYPLPDIMLLDLKMPRMDGFEALREIRRRSELKALRIIVLTSSEEVYDVNKAYDLGANSFLVKPLEFENYTAMMRTLSSFWLHQNKNPALERTAKNPKGGNAEKL